MADKIKFHVIPFLLLALSILFFFDDRTADAAKFMEVTNKIILQNNDFSSIVVNQKTNTIFVGFSGPCSPVASITVIDGYSEQVYTEIALYPYEVIGEGCDQTSLHNMVLNPETNMIYGIGSPNSIFAINATTNEKTVLNLEHPNYRGSIAINPNTNLIYLSDSVSTISVINGSTNQVIATINENDLDISTTKTDQTNYPIIHALGNNFQDSSKYFEDVPNSDYVIQPVQNNVDKLINVLSPSEPPPRLAINPELNKLYAAKAYSSGLKVIDLTTNKIIKNIPEIEYTYQFHINPVTNNVHLVDQNGISIIDGVEDKVISSVSGEIFLSMVTNEITKISYLLSSDKDLIALDTTTNEILDVISMDVPRSFLLGINENTNKIYVSTDYGLTVIDGLDGGLTQQSIPPIKQIKIGISIDQIKCKGEFELVLKSSDGSPACVKPETKIKLIERGWAKP